MMTRSSYEQIAILSGQKTFHTTKAGIRCGRFLNIFKQYYSVTRLSCYFVYQSLSI